MMKGDSDLRCEEVADLIGPFTDNELNLDQALVLEFHLENCFACKKELNSTKKLKELIAFSFAEEVRQTDPGDLAVRVGRKVELARPSRPLWIQPVWACAAIAVFLGIGFMVTQRDFLEERPGLLKKNKNDVIVEEIQAPNTLLALWREPTTGTTVIWLFDNQNGIQKEGRP